MKRLFGTILGFIMGIIFIVIGIFTIKDTKALISRCSSETTGVVVDLYESIDTDSDGDTTYSYYPIVEYKVNELTQVNKSKTGRYPTKFNINDRVDLLYNPEKPEEFLIVGYDDKEGPIGAIFIAAGIIIDLVVIFKFLRGE